VNYHTGALTLFAGGSAYRYMSDAANLAGDYRAAHATEGASQTAPERQEST
jgi:hypothetical protein